MSNEIHGVSAWVENRLKQDEFISAVCEDRVYDTVVPSTAIFPFIVFGLTVPRDVLGVGTHRVLVDTLYNVKAVAQVTSFEYLARLADRIDCLLHGFNGETGAVAGSVLAGVRESPFHLIEIESGREYRHLGGVYKFIAQAA